MTEPLRPPVPAPPPARTGTAPDLAAALERLDHLGAVPVHDHVGVLEEVDRALRQRLAAAEG